MLRVERAEFFLCLYPWRVTFWYGTLVAIKTMEKIVHFFAFYIHFRGATKGPTTFLGPRPPLINPYTCPSSQPWPLIVLVCKSSACCIYSNINTKQCKVYRGLSAAMVHEWGPVMPSDLHHRSLHVKMMSSFIPPPSKLVYYNTSNLCQVIYISTTWYTAETPQQISSSRWGDHGLTSTLTSIWDVCSAPFFRYTQVYG